jgi:DNA-binding PadR family transcriptional regulator
MLELATLGMLMEGPMHGYALKAWLERYMGSQITVNFGAIYPLLKRLSEQGLIASKAELSEGRKVTTYSVTAAGKKRFKAELESFPNESKVNARTRFMTKVYFFAHTTAKQRAEILQRRLEALAASVERGATMELPREAYQRSVFGFFMGQLEAEAVWVAELLAAEKARV